MNDELEKRKTGASMTFSNKRHKNKVPTITVVSLTDTFHGCLYLRKLKTKAREDGSVKVKMDVDGGGKFKDLRSIYQITISLRPETVSTIHKILSDTISVVESGASEEYVRDTTFKIDEFSLSLKSGRLSFYCNKIDPDLALSGMRIDINEPENVSILLDILCALDPYMEDTLPHNVREKVEEIFSKE